MVLVCFVLDLRNISPSLIGDLKQVSLYRYDFFPPSLEFFCSLIEFDSRIRVLYEARNRLLLQSNLISLLLIL